ncbi:Sialic acid TRAP transporter small permease protein SiaQ [Burkholderiales bacterium]|nr:Sialic acid TRAP transporter small permease protein SiaQ [Burkholderiales bacterium]
MRSVVAGLRRAEDLAARACLAGCAALVLVAAVSRALGSPILWAIDIAMLLFIWCAFLGADAALRARQHIIIDIVVRTFPQRVQRALLIAHWTVIVAFLLALVALGTQLTLLNAERPMGDTGISYSFVTAAVPIGSLLMAFTAMRQLLGFWRDPKLAFGAAESPL